MNMRVIHSDSECCKSSIGRTYYHTEALEKLLHDAKMYARATGQEEIIDSTKKSSDSIQTTPTNSPTSFGSRCSSKKSKKHNTESDIVLIDEDGFRYIPVDTESTQISEDFF